MPPTGCVFGVMGAFLLMFAAAVFFSVATELSGRTQAIAYAVAGSLVATALLMVVIGYRRMVHYSQVDKARRNQLATPWLWDHPWRDKSVADRTYKSKNELGCLAVAAVIFIMPFNIAYFADPDVAGIAVVLLLNAAAVALIGATWYFARRRAKYGQMRLEFSKFPYAPGEEVQAMLTGGTWMQELLNLKATLRCIEEWTTYRPGRKNTRVSRTASALYEEVVEYDVAALQRTQLDRIPIRFRIPEGIAVNQLLTNPATYWDLEVEAQVRGVDYRGHFLLPIYGQVG